MRIVTIDNMFEKVFLEGNDKIQQKLERHMSSREDRIYLYADANDLERHWWCKEKKKEGGYKVFEKESKPEVQSTVEGIWLLLDSGLYPYLLREDREYK